MIADDDTDAQAPAEKSAPRLGASVPRHYRVDMTASEADRAETMTDVRTLRLRNPPHDAQDYAKSARRDEGWESGRFPLCQLRHRRNSRK